MNDLIYRQAAIDALARTAREKFNLSDEYNHYLAGLMDGELAIKGLPTIQPEVLACGKGELVAKPEPKWIPVSERLPEKGGEYLVSVHHTIGAISVFHPEKDTYVDDVAIMKYYGKFSSTVRAWMPLPEAYKPNNE